MMAYVSFRTPTHVAGIGALIFLAACMVGLALLPTILRRVRRSAGAWIEGTCGRCGYSLHGLPSSICPECGADTKLVGSRWPAGARRWAVIAACVAWIGLLFFLNDLFQRDANAYLMRVLWGVDWYSGSSDYRRYAAADQVRRVILVIVGLCGVMVIYWTGWHRRRQVS